jgi:hypothetical protein
MIAAVTIRGSEDDNLETNQALFQQALTLVKMRSIHAFEKIHPPDDLKAGWPIFWTYAALVDVGTRDYQETAEIIRESLAKLQQNEWTVIVLDLLHGDKYETR